MTIHMLAHWRSHTVLAVALAVSPFVSVASPLNDDSGMGAVNALHLGGMQLSTSQLGAIRGGFDASPKLSISFGFQQIDSLGNKIIQSVMVPMTTLTNGAATPAVVVTGGSNTTVTTTTAGSHTTSANLTVPASTGSSSSTPSAQPDTSSGTAASNTTTTTTVVPANTTSITVSTKANNGQTVVLSQLGSDGITNVLSNTQNNALLSQVTSMNIDITGMSQFLSQQAGSFASATGAFGNPAFSR